MEDGNLEAVFRFEEIMEEINVLADEALEILKNIMGKTSQSTASARAYWHPQIHAIVDGHGTMEGMQDSLKKIKKELFGE